MKNMSMRLMNIENNEELLDKIIWKPFLNLAMVPYVEYEDSKIGYVSKKFPKAKELFGVCLNELRNRKMEFIGIEDDLCLFAVTNEEHFLGASLMVHKENLDFIHGAVRSNFWIFPSSVHEFMILKDRDMVDVEDLLNLVREINAESVSTIGKLSDSVYYYDGEKITVYKEVK